MSSTDPLAIALPISSDAAVHDRYSKAAQSFEPQLCCAVQYDAKYLDVIPQEIIERDYGCGDPTRFVREGETVLDLGSGGGKVCYIAAQVVGPQGRVIGVDCNDDMLELARKYQSQIAEALGYANVEFRKGRIQDLQLDLDQLETYLQRQPVSSSSQWLEVERQADELRAAAPLIASDSIDVIVSNCVLNLVRNSDRRQLFAEMHRVLKPGGRVAVSDIVCDRDVPEHLQRDPQLWSGCISGAFREDAFLTALEDAGFHGVQIVERQAEPWTVVEGLEFRSLTVQAYKKPHSENARGTRTVIYKGPWKTVVDDRNQTLHRGQRTDVPTDAYVAYSQPPYNQHVICLPAPGAQPPSTNCCEPGKCC